MKGIEPLQSEKGCRDNYAAALVIWGFEMKFEIKFEIKKLVN